MNNVWSTFKGAIETIVNFIPNLISAILLLLLAWIIAVVVKNIIVKGLNALGVDKWLERKGLVNNRPHDGQQGKSSESEGLIRTLGKLAYFLVFLLFLPPVFDALGMKSVSEPIKGMMNSVFEFAPRIIVAVIILVLGLFIAKMLGTLVKNLLASLNVSRFNHYVNFGKNSRDGIDIPEATGWIITVLIGLFFVVQALTTVNLDILNGIGKAIIGYLPLVISGLIILGLGLIGGNILAKLVRRATGHTLLAQVVKYLLIIVAVFMTLDQLNFAQSIVNVAFLLILGAVAVAFAIAFGIGGRGFAEKQLNSLSNRIEEDKRNPDYGNTDEPLFGSKQNNSYNNYSDAHYDNNHYDNNHYDNNHYDNAQYEDQHYNNASTNDHFEHSEFDADQREIERRQAEQKSDYVRNDEVEERREQRRERRRDPRDRH
ncbi:mechanosensitive ion channel [Staphylococcus chromogenes]|uniref:mechanosensitive ion channel n=1 Tax=Staphylococcus chromogenes TaxID=46126 RepID=UPI001E6437D2|nr:mechanosensitive ion channel [Staphylococcus chromogenes]MCD8904018.1 mechanosensitive ion channel [Staphylococcus chromogenes]